MTGKFRYAAFFIDEHSRFVFVEFLHDKSEVVEATKRVMAKFNALVGTPVDERGVAISRPRVRRLHRDHEGGLESRILNWLVEAEERSRNHNGVE